MKKTLFALTLLLFCFAFAAIAQTPTPTPADEDVVKISTTLIQIDAVVTDKKGNVVRDLKPADFEVYENGVKQEITDFSFVSGAEQPKIENKPDPKETDKIAPPAATVAPNQVKRAIALVVDDLTLSFSSVNYVRRALKKFVDEQMRDGDLVAIIRTGAGIGALQQFTSDKRRLYAAIEKVRWNPAGSGNVGTFAPIQSAGTEPEPIDEEAEDDGAVAASDAVSDTNSFRESLFAAGTLGAINYVVRGMAELPGRKSVMLFSDGFALFTQNGAGVTDSSRVLDALQKLTDAANRASVVIYTMDARGLVPTGLTAEDNVGDLSGDQIEQTLSDRKTKLFDTQEGLIYLAKETGGLAIYNNNDLSEGVRRMLNDQSYYLIGYEPDSETFDAKKRRFNKLEVRLKNKDWRVRYRSGFFNVTDEEKPAIVARTLTEKIQDALVSPFAAGEIGLRFNALFGNTAEQGSFVRSFLHIDAKDLTFTGEANGNKKAVFDILAVSYGDNGVPVDQISKTYTLNIKPEGYAAAVKYGFIYNFIFPVKNPGAYQLRVALLDRTSEKVGSANQFVEIPNIKKNHLTISGIILKNSSRADWEKTFNGEKADEPSDAASDTALRQFKGGTVLSYGAFIFNAKFGAAQKPDLSIQTRIFRDGKIYFEGKKNPVTINQQTDFERVAATGSLALGAQMPPGEYVLQIVVTDNAAKEKQRATTQFVSFDVIE